MRKERFFYGLTATLLTVLTLSFGAGHSIAQGPPSPQAPSAILVNAGLQGDAGGIGLFNNQVLAQGFSLRQTSTIEEIQYLIKAAVGAQVRIDITDAIGPGTPGDSLFISVVDNPPAPMGAHAYTAARLDSTITLSAGEYFAVFSTSAPSGLSLGAADSVGTSWVSSGPQVNSSDPWQSTFSGMPGPNGLGIRVVGRPVAEKLTISQGFINFGDVPVNQSTSITVELSNVSQAIDLLLRTMFQLPDSTSSGPFSLPTPFSSSLTANQKTQVELTFTPQATGVFEGTLLLSNNDALLPPGLGLVPGDAKVLQIPVRGRAVDTRTIIQLSLGDTMRVTVAPDGKLSGVVTLTNVDPQSQNLTFQAEAVAVPGQWFNVDLGDPVVSKDESMDIPLTFNAGGLSPADYIGSLIFRSFNPAGSVTLPVKMTVATINSIQGVVHYYNNSGTGVPSVVLTRQPVSGGGADSVVTDANGAYSFGGLVNLDYSIALARAVDRFAPGTPERSAVQGGDAVEVLRKSAFLTTLSGDQSTAADVTGDGAVNNGDAIGILRYLAFLNTNIGSTGTWRFSPGTVSVTGGAVVGAARGFLMGDVLPTFGGAPKLVAKAVTAQLNADLAAWRGDELLLPVAVKWDETVQSLLLSMEYDPALFEFVGARLTEVAEPMYFMADNGKDPGKIHIALAGLPQAPVTEPIVEVALRALEPEKKTYKFNDMAELDLTRFVVNDVPLPLGPDARFVLRRLPEEYELAQNYPNPFNPETHIGFALPDPGQVRMVIYNVLGQEIRELVNQEMPAGFHTVTWDGLSGMGRRVASGVYFYRIQTQAGFSASKRMLLLK